MLRRRGFLHRTVSTLLLCTLSGLLLIIPSVSSETDETLGNTPFYSHWQEGQLPDDGFDDDIIAESTDFSVGSFSLHRPQSELFMKGLVGELYDIAAAAAVEGGDLENYLQSRARAQVMDTAAPDFKRWLSSRGEGITERIFINSADYLTDYLSTAAVDNAEGLNFVHTIEWDYQTALGDRRWQTGLSALGALRESDDDAVVWQLRGYAAEDSGTGANAGLIYRRAVDLGGEALVGANVFLDYEEHGDYGEDFLRWSLGGEYRNAYLDIYLNRYFPISDAVLRDGDYIYTQGGQEAYINLKAPDFGIGRVSGGLTYYRWEGEYGNADDKGFRYHLGFSPRRGNLNLELQLDSPDSGDVDWGGRINYQHIIGSAKTGYGAISTQTAFDARAHFFDSVRREYAQRIRNSNDGQNRIAVARLLDNPTSTAEVAELDIFAAASATDPATELTLAVDANGVGESYTLSLSQTVGIAVGADSTLALSASNWQVTVYEESAVRLVKSGSELEIASGTVFFERSGKGLNVFDIAGQRIALRGTRGEAGVPDNSYETFMRLAEGVVAFTLNSLSDIKVDVLALPATAEVALSPAAQRAIDPASTSEEELHLAVGCASASQRDAHRFFRRDFMGCPGDIRLSGLANGKEVILHTQGDTLTLRGVASGASVSVVNAPDAENPLDSAWDAYPFYAGASTLEVKNDAVSIFYATGAVEGEAVLEVAANSTVAFSFLDDDTAAAAATATVALSIYAAIVNDGTSDNGAVSGIGVVPGATIVGCADSHLDRLSEGLVSVVAVCGAPSFADGNEREITGRTGVAQVERVKVSNGGGTYRFELSGGNLDILRLAAPTGTVAVLELFSDRPIADVRYRLLAVPLLPKDFDVSAAGIDIVARVVDESALPPFNVLALTDPDLVVLPAGNDGHNAGDDLFVLEASGGDDRNDAADYRYALLDTDEGKVRFAVNPNGGTEVTVEIDNLSGVNLTDDDRDSLQVEVELSDRDISAPVSRVVNIDLLAPLRAVVTPDEVVEPAPPSGESRELFRVQTFGGDGTYNYRIVSGNDDGLIAITKDGEVGVFSLSGAVTEEMNLQLRIEVTDTGGSTAAEVTVPVRLLPRLLVLTGPDEVVHSTAPHTKGRDLFALRARGGESAQSYRYVVSVVTPAGEASPSPLERHFGFTVVSNGADDAVMLVFTLAATVGEATEATLRIEVSDSVGTAQVDVTVRLSAVTEHILVIGGQVENIGGHTNEVWLSADGEGWTLLPKPLSGEPVFQPRHSHAAVAVSGTIYISGGLGRLGSLNDVWSSTDGIHWQRRTENIALAADGRPYLERHHMVAYENTLFVVGPQNNFGGNIWHSSDWGETWQFTADSSICNIDLTDTRVFVYDSYMLIANNLNTPVFNRARYVPQVLLFDGERCRGNVGTVPNFRGAGVLFGGDMYAAGRGDVWSSANGGATWSARDRNANFAAGTVIGIRDSTINGLSSYAMVVYDERMFIIGGRVGFLERGVRGGRPSLNSRSVLSGNVWSSTDGGDWQIITGVGAATQNLPPRYNHAAVVLGGTPQSQSFAPPPRAPLVLTRPTVVVRSNEPHSVGEELFTVTAYGGGGYRYSIESVSPTGYLGMDETSGAVSVTATAAAVSTKIVMTAMVTDSGNNTASAAVTVDLLSGGLLVYRPQPVAALWLPAPHAKDDVLFTVEGSGGNSANYAFSFTSADAAVLQTVKSGVRLQFQLRTAVTDNLPRVLSVTVVLNDGESAASAPLTVRVTLWDSLSLPPVVAVAPAVTNADGVIEIPPPYSPGKPLFKLAASEGSRTYAYRITPALEGDADVFFIPNGNRPTVVLLREVVKNANETRRIELTIRVRDFFRAVATRTVTVDFLSQPLPLRASEAESPPLPTPEAESAPPQEPPAEPLPPQTPEAIPLRLQTPPIKPAQKQLCDVELEFGTITMPCADVP